MNQSRAKVLKEIWLKLLGLSDISLKSDFFLLGGHPRLIAELLVEIKNILNITVTVRELVENSCFEKQLLLLEKNFLENKAETYQQEQTILNIFQKNFATNSTQEIIKFGEQSLSAKAFWHIVYAKSQHLKRIIRDSNLYHNYAEICIGIASNRTLNTVSDLVAILFAGAAFVPYDPNDPEDRINYILNDADVKISIINGRACLRESNIIITLETQASPYAPEIFLSKPEKLAYIIYTSGTTGRPKGVRISHRALWHFTQWWGSLEVQKLCHRVDFSASLTFDASITTTLIALAYDKLIVVCPKASKKSPRAFLSYLIENKVDLCKTTPSYFKLLVNEMLDHTIPIAHNMAWLLIGEEMNPKDCLLWLEKHHNHVLYNAYGPTEATVYCSTFRIDYTNINNFQKTIPIEHNSRNARFHIVDDNMQDLPSGIIGELCIEGPILADGYQKRHEESKSSFIKRPDGSLCYRTGDQVMENPDQSIIFLGRKDSQLKIQGVRVELDEIKHVISSLAGVLDAVVLVKTSKSLPELVALIVPQNIGANKNIFCDYIREQLSHKLPSSMMPHHYIILDKLPYNKAAKVDLQFLRKLVDKHNFVSGNMLVKNPLELSLLQLWRTSFKGLKIGSESNFFKLGGNSLLAMALMDKINRYFNISLPPDLIFQKPSIREMGQAINERCLSTNAYHFQKANGPALFMIHPASGIAHLYQIFSGLLPTVDFYGLTNDHFGENFYKSIEEMAHSYLKTLKTLRPKGPYFLGGYCTGGAVAFEMIRQLEMAGDNVSGLILIDSYKLQFLASKEDRENYNQSQLAIMGIREHSLLAQNMLNELDHNQLLVTRYQAALYSGDCLFIYCQHIDHNDAHKDQREEVKSRLNGWDRFLAPERTTCIGLNSSHRGIFRDEQMVKSMALEISQFIHRTESNYDKRPLEHLFN